MKIFFVKISCILLLFGLFGCGQANNNKALQPSKPTVLVSIVPYAHFIEQIAQGRVNVELLVPSGADPHTYEPTPKQVRAAHQAKLWIRIGDPFEEKILKALQNGNTGLLTLQMWEKLPLLPLEEHAHCSHHHHGHEEQDLHVWLSPRMAKIQAERIEEALTSLLPESRSFFEKNLKSFLASLDQLDQEVSSLLAPLKGRAILVSHPAFGYFCRDYGLTQLSIESEGKEALPQKIASTLKEAAHHRVGCVITQEQYSPKAAELVAEKLQLPIFRIDPYAENYFENLRQLANVVAQSS
jgi:zinc transport system substrate-binding protein